MAELDISKATIGYDVAGTKEALQKIRTEVIIQASVKLRNSKQTFRDTVHDVWKGKSAEVYLKNSSMIIDEIIDNLNETFEEKVIGTFVQIGKQMVADDQDMLKVADSINLRGGQK